MNRRKFTFSFSFIFFLPSLFFSAVSTSWLKKDNQSLIVVDNWILKREDLK
jgi:hypothetical protein